MTPTMAIGSFPVMRSIVVVSGLMAWAGPLPARQWLIRPIGTGAEFRGIHAVSDRVSGPPAAGE